MQTLVMFILVSWFLYELYRESHSRLASNYINVVLPTQSCLSVLKAIFPPFARPGYAQSVKDSYLAQKFKFLGSEKYLAQKFMFLGSENVKQLLLLAMAT